MNVLIYVMDALRADHLSCYGYSRNTTPNIDELTKEGIRFENCFSPATWTKPVGASLLTGAYPPLHGTRTREDVFDTDITRLPEELSKKGIYTAGFSTMGNVSASIGYDRGFQEYHDLYKDPDIVQKRKTQDTDSEELDHESIEKIALPKAEDLTASLTKWVECEAPDDFFAFCWSIEPHIPYEPPKEFDQFTDPNYNGQVDGERETLPSVETQTDLDHLIGLYDGGIKYNDYEFGRIVDKLKELDIYDETMVIVLGDHGDAFNEHGRLTHGHLPYDELVNVPLIIKPTIERGFEPQVIDEVVSLVDVAPTVMNAVGIDKLPKTVQGRPIPPFGPEGSSAPVFSETRSRDVYPAFYSVRTEDWKYMEVDKPDKDVGTLIDTIYQVYDRGLLGEIIKNPVYYLRRYRHGEDTYLYDLQADPEEKDNLINELPDIADNLQKTLLDWINKGESLHNELSQTGNMDIDAETNEQLRQLGYVD